MILFLSSAFLRRIRVQWKPGLKGFLIGDRNLFFFYPDTLIEADDFGPASIDAFLKANSSEGWQLLGFLTPAEIAFSPNFAELHTGNEKDPHQWHGRVHLLGEQGPEYRKLQILMSDE